MEGCGRGNRETRLKRGSEGTRRGVGLEINVAAGKAGGIKGSSKTGGAQKKTRGDWGE